MKIGNPAGVKTTPALGLFPHDELNLYLVMEDLKPATLVSCVSYERTEDNPRLIGFLTSTRTPYSEQRTENEERTMRGLEVIGKKVRHIYTLFIGTTEAKRDRLKNAGDDHKEFGLALGYPEDAVDAFCSSRKKPGTYMHYQICKAADEGTPIPLWLAYVHHIPQEFNLKRNIVPPLTKALATTYQQHVRRSHPDLAERFEAWFREDISRMTCSTTSGLPYNVARYYGPEQEKIPKRTFL